MTEAGELHSLRGSKMLKQVSIYAENRRGMMRDITGLLLEEDINILGSVTNDTAEYGVIRMVVSDPDKAADTFRKEGFLCKLTDVIGIEVEDEVGSLNRLLSALYDSNISVNYIYLSFNRDTGRPVMVFHTEDCYEVEECLERKGFTAL